MTKIALMMSHPKGRRERPGGSPHGSSFAIDIEVERMLFLPARQRIRNCTEVLPLQYYVTDSELFKVLREAHLAVEHGGRDRILKELSIKLAALPGVARAISTFV
ncbi:hypothetical protein TNCV_4770771 [Trichonephila clavipes]|nr:hypothetical protein TNCV_4770771 [Trichonephila clavipes]